MIDEETIVTVRAVKMAKSRYEYVKLFEKDDSLLPNTWIIVRLDGRGFHGYFPSRNMVLRGRFSKAHNFTKPNDVNALKLMNTAAKAIMRELSSDITLAYGDSDEYRYVYSVAPVGVLIIVFC